MPRFLSFLFHRKRAYPRKPRTGRVYLFSPTERLGAGMLMDESEGGVRLKSNAGALDQVSYILNPDTATASAVRLAWKGEGQAGFEYLRTINLRGYVDDPAIQHVRDVWVGLANKYGRIAPGGAFGGSARGG